MTTKSSTKTRFSADDAALVLIDHQSGIMQLVHDYSPAEFRNNVTALAKLGRVFSLPIVLTTSLARCPNGRFIPEVVSLFPANTGRDRRRNQILSGPVRLRRAGREIRMVIDGTHPFAGSKPDARLLRLLAQGAPV
jgi:nicotinamidase-related amidase